MKVLVVGAHDDDAAAWMGGTILRLVNWEWTVISLCQWFNREPRRNYFNETCRLLRISNGITGNFHDNQGGRVNDTRKMKQFISQSVAGKTFDYVFTHSRAPGGEYGGHANHDETRESVIALVQDGQLTRSLETIIYFAVKQCQPDSTAPFRVELTPEEVQIKKQTLASPTIRDDMVGLGLWDEHLQEVRCESWEAFDTDNLKMPPPFTHQHAT